MVDCQCFKIEAIKSPFSVPGHQEPQPPAPKPSQQKQTVSLFFSEMPTWQYQKETFEYLAHEWSFVLDGPQEGKYHKWNYTAPYTKEMGTEETDICGWNDVVSTEYVDSTAGVHFMPTSWMPVASGTKPGEKGRVDFHNWPKPGSGCEYWGDAKGPGSWKCKGMEKPVDCVANPQRDDPLAVVHCPWKLKSGTTYNSMHAKLASCTWP
jgi:hypothetical protein